MQKIISDKITECVRKDAPLSYHNIHDIYEIIEGDEYDVVTYDYYEYLLGIDLAHGADMTNMIK